MGGGSRCVPKLFFLDKFWHSEKGVKNSIYYLSGRNGKVFEGLGTFLQEHCDKISGREVSADLKGLKFEDQLEVIRQDLIDSHWHEEGQLVANSYGAYLLLHTLIDIAERRDLHRRR